MAASMLSELGIDYTTARNYVNTTARPVEPFVLDIVSQYLNEIFTPLTLLFGIFGNTMIVIIMRRATSGESVFQIYFIATAVFDNICLCTVTLGHWVRTSFGFDISATHVVICKVYSWLYTGGSTISCWCLVSLSVHRAMSVVWPHRVNVLCTRRTVLLVVSGFSLLFAVLYSHFVYAHERVFEPRENNYVCIVKPDENYLYFLDNIFLYIDLSTYCLLPFMFLVLSNSVLIWKLSVSVKSANTMLNQGDTEKAQAREKAANSVTLTVIVVSLAFIVLTLPISIHMIANSFEVNQYKVSDDEYAFFISTVCYILSYFNSAVNFYLYCLTGRRFREEFLKVMYCGRDRHRRGASSRTGHVVE